MNLIPEWGLYLILGALSGTLSGLFGIGGGVILVPLLSWLFSSRGFPPEQAMVSAIATSLATILFTALSSARSHALRGSINSAILIRLAPTILIGGVLGSIIASDLPADWLKRLFAGFLFYTALKLNLDRTPPHSSTTRPPPADRFLLAGLLIGTLSTILGIGGGTLTVPYLTREHLPLRDAIGTSAACGIPIALSGTLTYIWLGLGQADPLPWSLGHLYLPALGGILITGPLFAPLGVRLAHQWPTERLKRLFGVLLIIMGGKLLWPSLLTP